MIDLGTLAGLHEHQHELAAYCPKCERWRVLPLPHLVGNGKGSLRLPVKVRCIECGGPGRLQVRPPVPTLDAHRGGSHVLESAPAHVLAGATFGILARREDVPLNRLTKSCCLVFFKGLEFIQPAQEEQIGDLLNHFQRIGDATGPKAVPDGINLIPKFAGQHFLFSPPSEKSYGD